LENATKAPCSHEPTTTIEQQTATQRKNGTNITQQQNHHPRRQHHHYCIKLEKENKDADKTLPKKKKSQVLNRKL